MAAQQQLTVSGATHALIDAMQNALSASGWERTAAGGGCRVPLLVISRFAKPGFVNHTKYDNDVDPALHHVALRAQARARS